MPQAVDLVLAQREHIRRAGNGLTIRHRRLVREALDDMNARLKKVHIGSWSEAAHRATITMLAQGIADMNGKQVALTFRGMKRVTKLSASDTATYIGTLDQHFHGIARPLRFDTLAWWENHDARLGQTRLRMYKRSFARYGANTVTAIEDAIGKRILVGQPWTEARKEIAKATRHVTQGKQWMVDRIARTEVSAAYNGTVLAALIEEDEPDDPMKKKLVAIFDAVTGKDSIVLHGQTQLVNDPFIWTRFGSMGAFEVRYMAPPNRPNDREQVVGWRDSYDEDFPDYDAETATEAEAETGPRLKNVVDPPKPKPERPPPLTPEGRVISLEAQAASARMLKIRAYQQFRDTRSAYDDALLQLRQSTTPSGATFANQQVINMKRMMDTSREELAELRRREIALRAQLKKAKVALLPKPKKARAIVSARKKAPPKLKKRKARAKGRLIRIGDIIPGEETHGPVTAKVKLSGGRISLIMKDASTIVVMAATEYDVVRKVET